MVRNFQLLDIRTQLPITHIEHIPNFLNDNEIKALSNVSEQYEWQNGDMVDELDVNILTRVADIKWLSSNEENWWLFEKILKLSKTLNDAYWKFELYGINESLRFSKYKERNNVLGHHGWHMDVTSEGLPSNRKLTLVCGLNDDYEGGETSLILGLTEQRFKIRKGDAYLFPSFLVNKVYPATKGDRQSFTCWLSGPSFK